MTGPLCDPCHQSGLTTDIDWRARAQRQMAQRSGKESNMTGEKNVYTIMPNNILLYSYISASPLVIEKLHAVIEENKCREL